MDEIQYIGEHLLPRALGAIVTVVSFSAILFAVLAYGLSLRSTNARSFIRSGRTFFCIHAFSTFSLIGLMFFVMFNRYYEYAYAFEHVSNDLPFEYMFSAFWEGQQGSFLLWMFWHIILGFILIKKAREWEPGVLFVMSIIQLWLASMLLGVYVPFTNFKIGDNPMLLLREVLDIPLFANEDYLGLIEGKGLNLLLQNYWNVIHPPVTFLGFASVSVPFSFAISGLLKTEYKNWLKPALPWVLFAVGILGVGILMGSAWAYEALTFGGYWAWDPVENMSLVPWIMLVAGLHAHLITKATGYSTRSVYLFYILAFCLSIYSTYLVRSGALEETSVHAFTEMGMGAQLTAFLLFFIVASAVLLTRHWNKIPTPDKEESAYSREFYMFIGLMILAISSILITYSTSLPVINNIVRFFNPEYEGQVIQDANEHYNKYQLWIAAFISLLSGFAQWIRYQKNIAPGSKIWLRIASHLLLALAGTIAISIGMKPHTLPIKILLFSALYGSIANSDYLINRLKGNFKLWGSALSHTGFGIMLVGIIISGINKRQISQNPALMAGIFKDLDEDVKMKNVILLKNEPIYSQGYMLEYERDTFIGTERQYFVSFKELDDAGDAIDSFGVNPNVIYSKAFDNVEVYHPSIIRGVKEDIFTRIATLPREEVEPKFAQAVEDSLVYSAYRFNLGDTIRLKDLDVVVTDVIQSPETADLPVQKLDKIVGLEFNVTNRQTKVQHYETARAILRGNLSYVLPEKINKEELRIKVSDSILLPYLPYQDFENAAKVELRSGESTTFGEYSIRFDSFNLKPNHPFYFAQKNDIAVGADLTIKGAESLNINLQPNYIIRGNQVIPVDDFDPNSGLHIRFAHIDPDSETLTLEIKKLDRTMTLYIAENVPRTDFLVLEALAFPGINLFWLGACLMLGGVFFSWWQRRKQLRS